MPHKLLTPEDDTADPSSPPDRQPLIICFHGSGESCSPNWDSLASSLVSETKCRVLLWDRYSAAPTPTQQQQQDVSSRTAAKGKEAAIQAEINAAAAFVWTYLSHTSVTGPYILVAHSAGGAFARMFLQVGLDRGHIPATTKRNPNETERVIGAVLVETGQEGGLDPQTDERQIRSAVLADRPLVVVRGNSLIGKWKTLEEAEAEAAVAAVSMTTTAATAAAAAAAAAAADGRSDEGRVGGGQEQEQAAASGRSELAAQRQFLESVDAEDERLKKRQLALSRNSRYVHVPDVGHHVVRERPEVVVEAVRWVIENEGVAGHGGENTTSKWWRWLRRRVVDGVWGGK